MCVTYWASESNFGDFRSPECRAVVPYASALQGRLFRARRGPPRCPLQRAKLYVLVLGVLVVTMCLLTLNKKDILVISGVQSAALSFLMLRRCREGCFGHEGGPLGALSKELSSCRNRDVAGGHYVRDVLGV